MNKQELQRIVQPYTMASPERIDLLIELASLTNLKNIPGDFVECGVCNGGSAAILAHFAQDFNRTVHLFDSWQGLPSTTPEDKPSFGTKHPATAEIGKCVGSVEKVKEVCRQVTNGTLIIFHEGWFHETFPQAGSIQQIAMLNLDSDWYASEKLCLETWYDKVSPGGFIYFDDFYYWPGCQWAVTEFFANRATVSSPEGLVFNRVGHSAWIRKGDA